MKVDKQEIVELLRERGDNDKAEQAEQQLPDQVDHEEHSDLLSQIGVEPQEVLAKAKSIL
jgi:predicted PhzF superfamily epimerase YddE/YHI9